MRLLDVIWLRLKECESSLVVRVRWSPLRICPLSAHRMKWMAKWSVPWVWLVRTRMAYDRMIQIVDITSKLVSNALSHQQVSRAQCCTYISQFALGR